MIDWVLAKICGESLPSDRVIRWLLETYVWLIKYDGGYAKFNERYLVYPADLDFTQRESEFLAREIFHSVKYHAGMESWKCDLVQQDPNMAPGAELESQNKTIAGTFSMGYYGESPTITYAPNLLADIPRLIAVFAHELGHYYLANAPFDPPAGPGAEEHATDVTAILLGFGIFQANSVYYFSSMSGGNCGYLGEMTSSYALAIFVKLKGIDPQKVRKVLKSNPDSYFSAAIRDLDKRWNNEIQAMRFL